MPSIGDTLAGRYRLDAQIGSGGFATVFRARDLRLERDVAVKVLLANHASDPVTTERFDREARVLAAVSHPNVVAVHDVSGRDQATGAEPFLVMDLCEGGSLSARLAASETGALPPDQLVPILVDVATGLTALHARGIVHRDLKPSNVLLAAGRARIADLGIATGGPSALTEPGTAIGTLAYLAPEQLAGEPGSPASDVHALGVIAFLGLTGGLPRPAGSITEIVAGSRLPVGAVSTLTPGLGAAFDQPIASALAPVPAQRPTATELGTALGAALERWRGEPSPMTASDAPTIAALPLPGRSVAVATEARLTRGRKGWMAAVGGLVLALGLALAALMLLGSRGPGTGASAVLPGGAGGETPSAPVSPSVAASEAATASLTPTPTPTPAATVDPYASAHAASDAMRAAIDAARGSGGLNGHEAKDLENILVRFDRALDQQDSVAARDEANRLAGQVADLVSRQAVDAQVALRLRTAADRLVQAANALPR